jgi:hypothetical protein
LGKLNLNADRLSKGNLPMRIAFVSLSLAAVAALSISLAGCSSESPAEKTPAAQSGHYEGDGHNHSGEETAHFDGDGHDHGADAANEHPTEGPHGGRLIELGNKEFHAELLPDETTHKVAIHLLDAAGKQPVAIPQPEIALQLFQDGQFVKHALKAVQGPGDPAGAASQFEIVDAKLCDALSHEEETTGRLQVTIDGKPFSGTIEHSTHGDHAH